MQLIRCFVSSPGDTKEEREATEEIVSEINRNLGEKKFRLETVKWENDTYPGVDKTPQDVIDDQVKDDYEVYIGIMHTHFGTKTRIANSGTEHEFFKAIKRTEKDDNLKILFYFNDEPAPPSKIDSEQHKFVQEFKKKIGKYGVYYNEFKGMPEFKDKLRHDLIKVLEREFKVISNGNYKDIYAIVKSIFSNELNEALKIFNNEPISWTDPLISKTNDISSNPEENRENCITPKDIINSEKSIIIKAPPQFGLTCLSHYLKLKAWEEGMLFAYINAKEAKQNNIHKKPKNFKQSNGLDDWNLNGIIIDSWNEHDPYSFKKLQNLCKKYPDTQIILMQTIDDSKFKNIQEQPEEERVEIPREFEIYHLLALPRKEIRKMVSEYNEKKEIAEEDTLLSKVVSDMESLNIHRTPMNCVTLLKAFEKDFDESPVNRTNMLEMVLFVLFDLDQIPNYKRKPDLKDVEFVLGKFCEELIKSNNFTFSRDFFMENLKEFCDDNLLGLDVGDVFHVLHQNNIIIRYLNDYCFRPTFWVYYFAAKRMYKSIDFLDYMFRNDRYAQFPEIIEFYTGVDRNRNDAIKQLNEDLQNTSKKVEEKVGIPENFNPLNTAKWDPTEDQLDSMEDNLNKTLQTSKLPEGVKDMYADRNYDQKAPYDQTVTKIFRQYSIFQLMQQIKATSRGLRNSDHIDTKLKRDTFKSLQNSLEQISKVLFALSPLLAEKGQASIGGVNFILSGFDEKDYKKRLNRILQSNPDNVVRYFKKDIYSEKMGPLYYEQLKHQEDSLKKHFIALMIISEKPFGWKGVIEEYIKELDKSSFYLFDVVESLTSYYQYDFLSYQDKRSSEYLIKYGFAKRKFNINNPGLDKIQKISNHSFKSK